MLERCWRDVEEVLERCWRGAGERCWRDVGEMLGEVLERCWRGVGRGAGQMLARCWRDVEEVLARLIVSRHSDFFPAGIAVHVHIDFIVFELDDPFPFEYLVLTMWGHRANFQRG